MTLYLMIKEQNEKVGVVKSFYSYDKVKQSIVDNFKEWIYDYDCDNIFDLTTNITGEEYRVLHKYGEHYPEICDIEKMNTCDLDKMIKK